MTTTPDPHDPKADLRFYLQEARNALLWKLEGLSEYDIRRPLTPTGTNLLGLVKHVTGAELGYLGDTFGRPFGEVRPWMAADAEVNSDMWATADESRERIVADYRQVWAHSEATVEALSLDTVGRVPWWPDGRDEITLLHALVRVIADTQRHAGHADILREQLDGSAGMQKHNTSLPEGGEEWWKEYRERLEGAAREAQARGDQARGDQP
ncbi:DinB family protein [Streptomyces sp. NPDC001617]